MKESAVFIRFPARPKWLNRLLTEKDSLKLTGIQANFVLTTRNAEGQQCYKKRDQVTAEIGNHCFILSNSSA